MTKYSTTIAPKRSLEDQILSTISWTLNIAPHRLSPYTHFTEDLYLDELDMTLLIAALESQVGHYLSPEEVSTIETISDANRLFRQYLS